jgi:hypothetical protein
MSTDGLNVRLGPGWGKSDSGSDIAESIIAATRVDGRLRGRKAGCASVWNTFVDVCQWDHHTAPPQNNDFKQTITVASSQTRAPWCGRETVLTCWLKVAAVLFDLRHPIVPSATAVRLTTMVYLKVLKDAQYFAARPWALSLAVTQQLPPAHLAAFLVRRQPW